MSTGSQHPQILKGDGYSQYSRLEVMVIGGEDMVLIAHDAIQAVGATLTFSHIDSNYDPIFDMVIGAAGNVYYGDKNFQYPLSVDISESNLRRQFFDQNVDEPLTIIECHRHIIPFGFQVR